MTAAVRITGHTPKRPEPILNAEARESLSAAYEIARRAIKASAPKGPTGRLGSRVTRKNVRRTARGHSVSVKPTARYAHWVEDGSGLYGTAHSGIIDPKGKRARGGQAALKFKGPGGEVIYRAHSRGQRPQNFMRRARLRAEGIAMRRLIEGGIQAARRIKP